MEHFLHTGLVADPVCKLHRPGADHPESPERYDAIFEALCRSGAIDHLQKIACRPALESELVLCHTEAYIATATADVQAGAGVLSTGDTDLCERSLDAAVYTVGGVLNAVDSVLAGKVKNAFCLVRPPGHHATAGAGMGFCIFNNAALAARHAQRRAGVERVAIVDWDVHHGNGTQDIFYRDGSVFYFSTHQAPWYPGTGGAEERGAGPGVGATLNGPLPAGSDGAAVIDAFEKQLLPALDDFRPHLIVISAGFDSRADDPLGDFRLTDDDFVHLTRLMLDAARRHAGGRLVSVLEGGYFLPGLAAAATAHVETLMEA